MTLIDKPFTLKTLALAVSFSLLAACSDSGSKSSDTPQINNPNSGSSQSGQTGQTKDTQAPVIKEQTFAYQEGQVAGYKIGKIVATDDKGVVKFSIAVGNGSGYFALANTGELTLTNEGAKKTSPANDFENGDNQFTLKVNATDAAGNTSKETYITINLTNNTGETPATQVRYIDADGNQVAYLADAQCVQFLNKPETQNPQVLATVLTNQQVGVKRAFDKDITSILQAGNAALNKAVKVRSVEANPTNNGNPQYIVDGNTNTRWASTGGGSMTAAEVANTWVVIDLGSAYEISALKVMWEYALAKKYSIYTSNDNAVWDDAVKGTEANSAKWKEALMGIEINSYDYNRFLEHNFSSVAADVKLARYLKLKATKRRSSSYGYSIKELQVIGKATSLCGVPIAQFNAPTAKELDFLFSPQVNGVLENKDDAGYWYSDDKGVTAKAKKTDGSDTSGSSSAPITNYLRYIAVDAAHKNDWQTITTTPSGIVWGINTPAAPVAELSSSDADEQNSLKIKNFSGEVKDYEYSKDGGLTWQILTQHPLVVGNYAFAAEQIQIRLRAKQNQYAGVPLKAGAFTRIDVPAAMQATGKLNDTGITQTYNHQTCPQNSQEDCNFGRDKTLTPDYKAGAGQAGFDFTKLDASGNALADQTATGHKCVRDNHTGLVWEVKTNANKATKIYGAKEGSKIVISEFVAQINTANLCGKSNWRVPTMVELMSLLDMSKTTNRIDLEYFPNNLNNDAYWTATQAQNGDKNPKKQIVVEFNHNRNMLQSWSRRTSTYAWIRLVSDQ